MGPSRSPLTSSAGGVAWLLAAITAFWAAPILDARTQITAVNVFMEYTQDMGNLALLHLGWLALQWLLIFYLVRAVLSFGFSVGLMRLVEWFFRK